VRIKRDMRYERVVEREEVYSGVQLSMEVFFIQMMEMTLPERMSRDIGNESGTAPYARRFSA
jgi:hypothetical protein